MSAPFQATPGKSAKSTSPPYNEGRYDTEHASPASWCWRQAQPPPAPDDKFGISPASKQADFGEPTATAIFQTSRW